MNEYVFQSLWKINKDKLDTAILAASVAKSGCFVVRVAAVSAASSSSYWVETPS